jgi:hypothetical protein
MSPTDDLRKRDNIGLLSNIGIRWDRPLNRPGRGMSFLGRSLSIFANVANSNNRCFIGPTSGLASLAYLLRREAHIITRTKTRRRGCPNSQSKPALILIGKAKKEKETLMTEFNREEAIADIL